MPLSGALSNYRVITAYTCEDCIRKYAAEKNQGNKIDILLLDYRLGDQVACKIRELDGTR